MIYTLFGYLLFFGVIVLMSYIYIGIEKNKKKSMQYLEDNDIAGAEQVFVQHRGVSFPLRRRELPLWNKMGISERTALMKTFLNASKKGRLKKDDKWWFKKAKQW